MLCVVVVCGLKIMCCIATIFMMQRLTSMGLIIQPNTNTLEFYEKVALDGASTKDSCSSPKDKKEIPVPQLDSMQKLSSVVLNMEDSIKI